VSFRLLEKPLGCFSPMMSLGECCATFFLVEIAAFLFIRETVVHVIRRFWTHTKVTDLNWRFMY